MKTFLVLSCLIALAYGVKNECHCGAFVSLPDSEQEVLAFPPIELDSCEEILECSIRCIYEWEVITLDGDLCHQTPDGSTVGQKMCDNLEEKGMSNAGPYVVFLYFRMCEGPWGFDGQSSKQRLECRNGNMVIEC
ncbi:hypothetical protein GWK47_022208 [Chionoecetes opilio]|uniref:Uncharacterized protein n=1 Tax=Chionoecetes opilio TaxID=41210 RepID=A0A8J4XN88_CHIOP|nr:hypothetical protein GWK47_022208 [Chionoecetes opilio]